MKAVLISIKPKWCELIANGKKTVEVRKTRPKIETPFKCYIYCTNDRKVMLEKFKSGKIYLNANIYHDIPMGLNGKVIGEFVCDVVEGFRYGVQETVGANSFYDCYIGYPVDLYDTDDTCLTRQEIDDYGNKAFLYGWHISDLVIYDCPKNLSEFYQKCKSFDKDEWESDDCVYCENPCGNGGKLYLKRPPQSWCYVEELE